MIEGADARKALMAGIVHAANILSPTLGPAPRLVMIESGEDEPLILDDGVNISKHITADNPYEMLGVKILRMVAHEAQRSSGDGTTTASVIAKHLILSLFEELEKGEHPVVLAASLDESWELFKEYLTDASRPATEEDLLEVARSCTNYDEDSSQAVFKAFRKVGAEGVVMVHQSPGEMTTVEINEGLTLNKGFVSHLFAGSRDGTIRMENPLVLVTDHILHNFEDLVPALSYAHENKRPLIIVAAGAKANATQNLIYNVVQGKVNACLINPIATGEERAEIYEDIATMLGGNPILAARGQELTGDMDWGNVLGGSDVCVIDRNTTVFSGTHGDLVKIDERIDYLRELIDNADHPFYADKYRMRRSKLQGQIATIRVGGLTDAEVSERHERIDDAVNAVRSALKGGIVPGGGMTLWKANTLHTGLDNALKSVLHTLVKNRGCEMEADFTWFDGVAGKFHFDEIPLVDAHDVVFNSVKAAVSVAMLVLKTDVLLPESL